MESLKRGELIAIADVRVELSHGRGGRCPWSGRHARSFVNVPVVEKGRLVAVLYINHRDARDWSQEDVSLVREVAERTRTAAARLRSEAALRDSEMRLAVATEAAEIGVWEWDLATNAMTYSAAAREISGFDAEAHSASTTSAGSCIRMIIHARRRWRGGRSIPAIRERLALRISAHTARWRSALGGRARQGRVLRRQHDAKPLRYIGTLQDVTARRHLEETTREERAETPARRRRGAHGRMGSRPRFGHGQFAARNSIGCLGIRRRKRDQVSPKSAKVMRRASASGSRRSGRPRWSAVDPFIEAEYRHIRPDGESRWLLLRCEILMDAARQAGAGGRRAERRHGTPRGRGGSAHQRDAASARA